MPSFRDVVGHAKSGGFGWKTTQYSANSSIVLATDAEPQRVSNGTLRITVRPGDSPVPSGERSEVFRIFNLDNHDEDGSSGAQFYGISVYLPSAWKDTSRWCIVAQLHGPDSLPGNQSSPVFALDISVVPGRYTLSQRGGDTSAVARLNTDLGTHVYDQWVDFLFRVQWATDSAGETAVWTRVNKQGLLQQRQVGTNRPIRPWNTPTLFSSNGKACNHYWKRGIYRNAEDFVTILYAGPFSRADNMPDAAWAAFGQWP